MFYLFEINFVLCNIAYISIINDSPGKSIFPDLKLISVKSPKRQLSVQLYRHKRRDQSRQHIGCGLGVENAVYAPNRRKYKDNRNKTDSLPAYAEKMCLMHIEDNVKILKAYLEENMNLKKDVPEIPEAGMAVLRQQYLLAQAIETWIASLKEEL